MWARSVNGKGEVGVFNILRTNCVTKFEARNA